MALDEERAISQRLASLLLAPVVGGNGTGGSEARCQQATTCRRRGVAYLRRAPAPCAVGVGCGAAPPLAGWLLAAWLPACVTVTEYRIDAGLRQQNLSFYEGGQQNDEGGQNRYMYNCTSTYCVPVQMYAVVSSCTRLYRYTAVRRPQNCRRVDHFRRQMDHVIKTADESITSPKFT